MIIALQNELGYDTHTQVFIRGVEELYKNTFKYGKDPIMGIGSPKTTDVIIENAATIKAKQKKARVLAEAELKLIPKRTMCLVNLGGTITRNEDGTEMCNYKTHDVLKSEDQTLPLIQVGEYLLENQYIPSKEAVLKKRPKLI